MDTAKVAAEILGMPWEDCEVIWGDTSRHLPWSFSQGGSQTTLAHTRANHAVGMDAKRKFQEIAARDLGDDPEDYDTSDGRVFQRSNPSRGMSFAQAATRAIELGGRYSGEELAPDLNDMTKASATALAWSPRPETPIRSAEAFARSWSASPRWSWMSRPVSWRSNSTPR